MDNFLKSIRLSFDVDKQNVSQVKALFENLQKDAKFDFSIDVESISSMRELIKLIEQQIAAAEQYKDFNEVVSKGLIDEETTKNLQDQPMNAAEQYKDFNVERPMNPAEQYKDFDEIVLKGLIDEETAKNLQEQVDQLRDLEEQIRQTSDMIDELSKLQSDSADETIQRLKDYLQELQDARDEIAKTKPDDKKSFSGFGFKQGSLGAAIQGGKAGVAFWGMQQLQKIGQAFLEGLKSVLSDAWSELGEVLSYSQLTNAEVREQAFTYGFTPSENYAFSQTMELMGFSSFEDLYYMNSQQQAKFQEKFLEYQDRYAKLYDSGYFADMQDFQWEMQEFKEDLTYEVMTWMMDNKETLMNLMEVITEFAMITIEALGWIVDYFGDQSERSESSRTAATVDIINNNSVASNSTNVKIDNTFNNVDAKDRSWLANAGEMTYEQIIKALE